MLLKPALSIQDQLTLLRSRGMSIDNEPAAADFLSCNHYYRLNIYFHKLMDSSNHFRSGTLFSQVIAIYNNDSWLRNKILTLLEPIEIKTRTQISYYLGMTYGPNVFYQKGVYKDQAIWQVIQDNFSKEIFRNQSDPIIKHHMMNYGGMFPIWVVVEFLSFNTLSKFYSSFQERDKKIIAKNTCGLNEHMWGQWLHVLSVFRNVCAHYGYLYRREYPLRPIIAKSFGWSPTKNDRLFAIFMIMRRLSDATVWQKFIQTISEKENTTPSLHLKDYGFPPNWQTYLVLQ
jgi:abortive infection bacteriophage resistance protein